MKIKFICPHWGNGHLSFPAFLEKAKSADYEGVEIGWSFDKNENKKTLAHLKSFDLEWIGQHYQTATADFQQHKETYKRHLYSLAEAQPLLINSHTGRDFFSFEQNTELIQLAAEIEKETGVPIAHETHRSRFPFAAHRCYQFLQAFPEMKLTADLSHWCCVAESMLENQQKAVHKAIEQTYHIHARVGSSQSPQVLDPRDPAYAAELAQFKKWWQMMIDQAHLQGRDFVTVAPEYGPAPYALNKPYSEEPLADLWDINLFIKNEIASAFT